MINNPLKTDDLLKIAAFKEMPLHQLERLATVAVWQTYSPGQIIFLEGEVSGGLWFVQTGRVKIIKQSLNGRILGLCMMTSGKCFGSCPLFGMDKNPATAQAVDEVTLLVVPQERLNHLIHEDANLAGALLRIYSQRLLHLARLSEKLGAWTTGDRINDCLLAYAEPTDGYAVVRLTHEKLADLAGTVREVVTRHLSQLERGGTIQIEQGHILLLDTNRLSLPCVSEKLPRP
jgi:CRP/FNR family transcriptional regulator